MHTLHQPVHSSGADVYAIVTLKDVLDLVSPKAFVIISINMQDHGFKTPVFRNAGGRFLSKMLVISTPVDIQNTAECTDVMLKTELVNSI